MSDVSRPYRLGARGRAADARKERILVAALELLLARPLEQVTLAAIAERAEVSLKTVVRGFPSKERLILTAARWSVSRERASREVPGGDIPGAARVLAQRYEQIGDRFLRRVVLEQQLPALRALGQRARASHLEWLSQVFAPWLPPRRPQARRLRLMALFGATEIYVWVSWRRDLGLSAPDAERTMRLTLEALVAQFERTDGPAKRRPQ